MRREWLVWIALGVVSGVGMAMAAWLLTSPVEPPPIRIPFMDKVYHVVMFACLAGPGIVALPKRYQWFWLAHMAALGVGIEIVQARTNVGRSGDVLDFVADCVGIALAWGLGRMLRRRFETVA
jgi:hypothetical protein